VDRRGGRGPAAPFRSRRAVNRLRGSCHCRALGLVFAPSGDLRALEVRACQCSFCRRHGSRTATDPAGRARLIIRDPSSVERHRFGTRTTDFVVCARCGVYVGAFIGEGEQIFATVNVNAMDDRASFAAEAKEVRYDGETADARVARRMRVWTPADVITCELSRASSPQVNALLSAYYAELAGLLGEFDPRRGVSAEPDEVAPPRGAFLVVTEADRALACGGLKTHAPGVGEIKRMFVAPEARGRSLARDLLAELEDAARALGMGRIVLDTAAPLAAAAALYRSAGYVETAPFNANPYAARWFEKSLG
jgi:GNAT superfamily N-acetyltransferase